MYFLSEEGEINREIYELLSESAPPKPVRMVREKQERLGLSDRQLSQLLGIARPSLKRFFEGETQKLDVLTLLKIHQFLDVNINTLIKSYVATLPKESIAELERVRKAKMILESFDLPTLKKIGFIHSTSDLPSIEKRIVDFFELKNIFEYQSIFLNTLYSSTKNNSNEKMRKFWILSAVLQFQKMKNPHPYNREVLLDILSEIPKCSQDEEFGLLKVAQALYHVGVSVIVQDYIALTQARGATFIVDGKPCVVLTNYKKSYATLWFTLMHELYHVLHDFDKLEKQIYHLSDDSDIFLMEKPANDFAKEQLVGDMSIGQIEKFIKSPTSVIFLAARNNIHPSIIYDQYLWQKKEKEGISLYGVYGKYIPDSSKAIKEIRTYPWNQSNIGIGIQSIKKKLETINSQQ